jgi:hypothetical protein
METVWLGLLIVMFAVTLALAAGCERLQKKK